MESKESNSKFGVKNYLHYFYEDCSGVGLCEVEHSTHLDITKKRKSCRWITSIGLCIVGFLVASAGLILLVLGELNSQSDAKAIAGGVLLCIGGVTGAMCLTLINIEIIKRKQGLLEQIHFQERCKEGMLIYRESEEKKPPSISDSLPSTPALFSPSDLPVSLYQVSAVQPQQEDTARALGP